MPNFSAEAAAVDAVDLGDVTFEELVDDVARAVAKIQQEVAGRGKLEELAPEAEEVVPGEFRMFVEVQGYLLRLSPAALGLASLAPLVEPLRQSGAEYTVRMVEDATYAMNRLYDFCTQPRTPADAGPAGPAPAPGAAPPPEGILASLQQRLVQPERQPAPA